MSLLSILTCQSFWVRTAMYGCGLGWMRKKIKDEDKDGPVQGMGADWLLLAVVVDEPGVALVVVVVVVVVHVVEFDLDARLIGVVSTGVHRLVVGVDTVPCALAQLVLEQIFHKISNREYVYEGLRHACPPSVQPKSLPLKWSPTAPHCGPHPFLAATMSSSSFADDRDMQSSQLAYTNGDAAAPRPSQMPHSLPAVIRKKLMGYVGFANLPNQVHRKSVRKGFNFTAMVVGRSLFYPHVCLFFYAEQVNRVLASRPSSTLFSTPRSTPQRSQSPPAQRVPRQSLSKASAQVLCSLLFTRFSSLTPRTQTLKRTASVSVSPSSTHPALVTLSTTKTGNDLAPWCFHPPDPF